MCQAGIAGAAFRQLPDKLTEGSVNRLHRVGIVWVRLASRLLKVRPLPGHPPPLHISLSDEFIQQVRGVEDVLDVIG